MQFHIENMTCSGCARRVTKAIQSVDKAAVINADPENRKIDVETSATRAEIKMVLAEAGWRACDRRVPFRRDWECSVGSCQS